MSRLRTYRPSPALLVALLALFFAVGGVGYAKRVVHLIDGGAIKKGSIQLDRLSAKAQGTLKGRKGDSGSQGVQGAPGVQGVKGTQGTQGAQGPPGAPGSDATLNGVAAGGDLTGTYPSPSLGSGTVTTAKFAAGAVAPDAASLGGLTSDQFIHGSGHLYLQSTGINHGGIGAVLTVPNAGEVDGSCGNPALATVKYTNTSDFPETVFTADGSAAQYVETLNAGNSAEPVSTVASADSAQHVSFMVSGSGTGSSFIDVYEAVSASGTSCFFYSGNVGQGVS